MRNADQPKGNYRMSTRIPQKSEWQTKELATSFLEGVRGAMPCADLQLEIIGTKCLDDRYQPDRLYCFLHF